MKRLQDKVAIVTGGANGFGRAYVQRFAEEGAKVVIADIDQPAIELAVRELQDAGHAAMGYNADVTNRSQLKELMKAAAGRHGRIDILVNNAGVTRNTPFLQMGDEAWNFVLDVDLKGVFYGVQAVAEYMIRQKYGKIVNISSAAGTGTSSNMQGGSSAGTCNYIAAKAAVIQLTKTLARELGPYNINVNCVAPGNVGKSTKNTTRTAEEKEAHAAFRRNQTVLKRTGTLEELANAVLFMVSDEASFISGQLLCVDGGRTDRM